MKRSNLYSMHTVFEFENIDKKVKKFFFKFNYNIFI